jgi:hypothetical protein
MYTKFGEKWKGNRQNNINKERVSLINKIIINKRKLFFVYVLIVTPV